MDEATRRSLLFGKEVPEQTEHTTRRLSELAEGMSGGLEGLRQLQEAGFEAPEGYEYVEVEEEWTVEPNIEQDIESGAGTKTRLLLAALGIFILALIPRLLFLYVVTDPEVLIPSWSNDTWHRWQIAYLSKAVGFQQDPARLWDLKGMEYFWGLVHPLLSVFLFNLTGSVDVMILRWITFVAGALNIVFLYLIGRRFWGNRVGIAIALISILNPIVIFNDPSGMVEPISFLFLLAGIYFYPRRSLIAGLFLGIAAMARAEAWLMSAGLLLAAMFAREPSHKKIGLAFGWVVPVAIYMKHLVNATGNAIYPIYWNFLANAAGRWAYRPGFEDYQLAAKPVLIAIFVIAGLGAAWTLWQRPRGYLIHLLGLGTTAFIGGFIGLTAYLKSYEPWFWLTRFFVFPYLYLGILAAVILLVWLPAKNPPWRGSGAMAFVGLVLATQLLWPAVLHDVNSGYTGQTFARMQREQGETVARWYAGGKVLIPEHFPQLTYAIVRYGGIEGDKLLSQMYNPIYYYEGEDPFQDWEEVGTEMWEWLEDEDVELIVMDQHDERFTRMRDDRPDQFRYLATIPYAGLEVYWVGTQ